MHPPRPTFPRKWLTNKTINGRSRGNKFFVLRGGGGRRGGDKQKHFKSSSNVWAPINIAYPTNNQ